MTATAVNSLGLLESILSDETFHPAEPKSVEETGLSGSLIESLMLKYLLQVGSAQGRTIARRICLPFGVLEGLLNSLRTRQLLVHKGHAEFNDFHYGLTEQGHSLARSHMQACSYVGPAPIPLEDYVLSVEAQTIRAEPTKRPQLAQAFCDITVPSQLVDSLGPAINSGAGMFLYGEAGNGKTTLAKRITRCFGQHIWIPQTLIEDGQFIGFFDAAYHEPVEGDVDGLMRTSDYDTRWVKTLRPTVMVGGELTLDNLEIRHDPVTNVSEASLQLKSNCGCLLIDDFGRQRVEPAELFNRWIVPLENHIDYLTLVTGKKVKVPFDQLIIFSTNLEPAHLGDDAFLRRVPYKIKVTDPSPAEFQRLFEMSCQTLGCEYRKEVVDHVLQKHYRSANRPLRRCHPRDLLSLVRDMCVYHDLPLELRTEYFDRVATSYFPQSES